MLLIDNGNDRGKFWVWKGRGNETSPFENKFQLIRHPCGDFFQ